MPSAVETPVRGEVEWPRRSSGSPGLDTGSLALAGLDHLSGWRSPGSAMGVIGSSWHYGVMNAGAAGSAAPASRGRVLVVDDDAPLAEMLTIVLRQEGFDSRMCTRGDLALAQFRDYRPDLVLLDLMLPGKDGIDVCKEIRGESGVPIVMLTAKGDTVDVVVGLESGADDYVVKPFKPRELVARIRARVRRTEVVNSESLTLGDLSIDVAGHSVSRRGVEIGLTPLEFDLLLCLARRPWQVFTRQVLLEEVWGYRHAADTRLVNVHVQRLRAKVEHDPEHPELVVTVRGVGYKAGTTAASAAH